MGPYPSDEISPGLDSSEDLRELPANFTGRIWTNTAALFH